MLILFSTDVGDFTWAFERFGAPPQVGFALTAALRSLPELIGRTTLVLKAVELRGYDLSRPRWFEIGQWPGYARRAGRCVVLITVPLLVLERCAGPPRWPWSPTRARVRGEPQAGVTAGARADRRRRRAATRPPRPGWSRAPWSSTTVP